MAIRIITDSGSDIQQNQYQNVVVLPLQVSFGEENYLDGVDIDAKTFYERLEKGNGLPKTSQCTPYQYEQAYKDAIEAGDDILVITVTSKLSGCYQSANIAADLVDQKVYIIDSESVAVGIHCLVLEALKLIEQGLTIQQVYEQVNELKNKLCVYALVDTLEYLKRGGRISNITALAGTIFSIKPVLTIEAGLLEMAGKARGLRQGATLLTRYVERTGVDLTKAIVTGYSGTDRTLLANYIEAHKDLFEGNYSLLTEAVIGPGIGTHAGPGAIAVGFFSK